MLYNTHLLYYRPSRQPQWSMVVWPDSNIVFCTYQSTDNILWVELSTYTTREPTKKTPYNRSTNTIKRPASQTNGNFLFLVRRLNILWAINQGRSWRFVTLVFLSVLNDNDVFWKSQTTRLFKCLKNVRSFYVGYYIGIVSLQYCIIIHYKWR